MNTNRCLGRSLLVLLLAAAAAACSDGPVVPPGDHFESSRVAAGEDLAPPWSLDAQFLAIHRAAPAFGGLYFDGEEVVAWITAGGDRPAVEQALRPFLAERGVTYR